MIGISLSMAGNPSQVTVIQQAIAVLRRFGTNAHVYLPGVGMLNGLTAGNYLDSTLSTLATIDNPVGGVVDTIGGINATQPTTASKPILRRGAVNLLTYSGDFSNAAWIKGATATVTGTNQLNFPSANDGVNQSIATSSVGRTYTFSAVLSGNGSISLAIRVRGGGFGAVASNDVTLSATPTIFSVTGTITDAAATGLEVYIRRLNGTTATTVIANYALVEDVSGQADQTASEYVSVGVLSAPFHGAGVDGCKYFATNKNGTPIYSSVLKKYLSEPSRVNNCLWGRDATNAAWTKSNITAAKTATGLDNVADSASRLTATANDATLLQLLTAATGTRTTSAWIKAITLTQKPELSPGGGTFDSSFGWTLGSWTIGGGVASIVASPGSILRIASSPAALGKVFVFSYTITSISGANVQAHAGGTLGVLRSTPGTYTESIVCGSVDTLVGIAALSGATATIDNLSIKESAISLTRNGGTGWTDITSSLVAGTWVPVEVTSDVGANPTVGLKMGTSGDVIDVDCFQDENGAWRTSPILTTTAAVTRNADVLSYTHAGILDDAQGTILASASVAAGQTGTTYVLSTSGAQFPLYKGNSGANLGSADGTTTLFGAAWANDGISRKCAVNWSGVSRKVCMNGGALNSGAYDGSWNATALYPGSVVGSIQMSGNIGEVHVWRSL